jgi:hypothetical protein
MLQAIMIMIAMKNSRFSCTLKERRISKGSPEGTVRFNKFQQLIAKGQFRNRCSKSSFQLVKAHSHKMEGPVFPPQYVSCTQAVP